VNAGALAGMAHDLGLGEFLMLGRGEDAAGGRHKESIVSDALEAVIGAVYLDGGAEAASTLVRRLVDDELERVVDRLDHLDHKTRLQELLAQRSGAVPRYLVRSEGPDHDQRFFAVVMVSDDVLGEGQGPSKKRAEQAAAAQAVARVQSR
jgi:ribonuclease-3